MKTSVKFSAALVALALFMGLGGTALLLAGLPVQAAEPAAVVAGLGSEVWTWGLAAAAARVRQLFLCHLDPSAWRGAGDPAEEARGVFPGEVIVAEPGTWYSVTP